LEQVGLGDVGQRFVNLEEAVRRRTAGMDDALRDALMVEMENLLAEMKVFEEGGASGADFEAVLVVRDWAALSGGQDIAVSRRDLVKFTPFANTELSDRGGSPRDR
jgi:hypothetical protein